MEIKTLSPADARLAASLAQVVFRGSIEPNSPIPQMHAMFYEYADEDRIAQLVADGQLTVWGAFEEGYLCGMGAMQPEGHITMLYVLAQWTKRGIGTALLQTMQKCAFEERKLTRLTVNAYPIWTVGFFRKFQFKNSKEQSPRGEFVSMAIDLKGIKVYRKRSFPATAMAVSAFVVLGVALLTAICYIVFYL